MKTFGFWARIAAAAIIAGIIATLMASCKKESAGFSTVKFHLTDAPGMYNQVNVDIQQLYVNVDGKWQTIPLSRPGVYNLLDFKNGLDTVLGTVMLPAGKIGQVRMVLGSNNTIMADSVVYDLTTPSAEQSGLKFNFHDTLEAGLTYEYWIDFDAGRSIVATGGGKGKFILKPVIRMYAKATSGAIKGDIDPDTAADLVIAYDAAGTVVANAIPNADGTYLFAGLAAGTYSLEYQLGGVTLKTVTGISVSIGAVTDQGQVMVP